MYEGLLLCLGSSVVGRVSSAEAARVGPSKVWTLRSSAYGGLAMSAFGMVLWLI